MYLLPPPSSAIKWPTSVALASLFKGCCSSIQFPHDWSSKCVPGWAASALVCQELRNSYVPGSIGFSK
jgi:hypothetical protein